MAKVFRIHKEGSGNIIDWQESHSYGDNVIKQIVDPFGAKATKEITSIPSPFSRIDLAVTAFKNVCDSGLEGDTIYHKIVSDCLDIGEIFFNVDNFKDPHDRANDKIEILVWDRNKELDNLSKGNIQHKLVGATLDMYLNQDARTYNFDKMDRIYLLNYKGPDRRDPQVNIIGATSPATLFFSSANDLTYVSDHLRFRTNDCPFDSHYSPLFMRDIEFQKFLYAFRLSIGKIRFAELFEAVNEYLDESYARLSNEYKTEIDTLNEQSINIYEILNDGKSNQVDILGYHLRKRNETGVITSDFEIMCSSKKDGLKPLVLPVKAGNSYADLSYVQGKWDCSYQAPYNDSSDLDSRHLPYVGLKYPYLTIDDFLSRNLIYLPFDFNGKDFYNGNSDTRVSNYSYLLPLTKTFFEYFSVKDLTSTMKDGKNMFELRPANGGSVRVVLRIPIKNGRYIEYERFYVPGKSVDLNDDSACIVEKQFGMGVLPLVRFGDGVLPGYRIAMFSKSDKTSLEFANDGEKCDIIHHVIRRKAGSSACSVESYVLENNFDVIYVTVDGLTNVIVPRFRSTNGGNQFTFAIDFGTTNTHVEYSVDKSSPRAFDISNSEIQLCRFSTDYADQEALDINVAFEDSFIPSLVGGNSEFKFPIRTAFAEWGEVNYQKHTEAIADGNIPFRYEKARMPFYNKVKTDLKWASAGDSNTRVKLYLETLFIMLRNKVLLNGGRLSDTKIVWFYPASMSVARKNSFEQTWESLFKKYIGSDNETNLLCLSESAAPYFYYKNKKGITSDAVTIDIGGGTTDVFVVQNNIPTLMTSFRFASNSIFGDGYNWSPDSNGFVKKFSGKIEEALNANSQHLKDVQSAFTEIMKSDNSSDISAFFFSLATNASVAKNRIPLDYLKMLAEDSKMKYVFIIFYGSVIYYLAKMMKAKNLNVPQVIAFSGNGSKTLSVLSTSDKTLSDFVTCLFRKVYGHGEDIRIINEEEPKLATSKGGIYYDGSLSFDDVENMRYSLLGTDGTTSVAGMTYNQVNNEETIRKVSQSVGNFIDDLFSVENINKILVDSLGADASLFSKIPSLCKKNLEEYTKQGLKAKLDELKGWGVEPTAPVEETMFFYPVVAMLNYLAREISNM